MHPARDHAFADVSAPPRTARSTAGRLLLQGVFLLVAVAALGAYEHFKLHGQSTPSPPAFKAPSGEP